MARGSPTRRPGSSARKARLPELLAKREEIVDHRLAAGGGGLAEFIGALIAPITLLAFDDELLHVAEIRAGLADEVARGEAQLMQVVTAETRVRACRLMPLPRDQRHADRAHHAVVRGHRDLLSEHAGESGADGVVVRRAALEIDRACRSCGRAPRGSDSSARWNTRGPPPGPAPFRPYAASRSHRAP